MDNRQANINRFEAEMAKVTRDGVDKLMAFIRKSDVRSTCKHQIPPFSDRRTVAALTQCTGCTEGEPHKER